LLFVATCLTGTASHAETTLATQLASLSAAAQGGDGCYFGECPEGGAPTPTLPDPQQTQNVPNQTPWPQQTNQVTSICQTPAFWCQMWETGPVGADCWCADWYGNIYTGQTVSQ